MLVTDIEITNYHYCHESCQHQALVSMTLQNHVVTMMCQVDLPDDEPELSRAAALVSEATRQMHRMPEFRAGQKALEFAKNLISCAPPELA